MQLNCKVIKKWQPTISTATPPFQVYPPSLAKFLVPSNWLSFWKVLHPAPIPPLFNKRGGSNYVFVDVVTEMQPWTQELGPAIFSSKKLTYTECKIHDCRHLTSTESKMLVSHPQSLKQSLRILKVSSVQKKVCDH